MPTIIRKSIPPVAETRREILHAISWHVRTNIWSPPVDVYETDENFVVKVEIAGMRDDDFEVAVENNILMISGYRPDQNERRAYHQMEIMFGKFELAFNLPSDIEVDNATAQYKDGFLVIVFPRLHTDQNEVE